MPLKISVIKTLTSMNEVGAVMLKMLTQANDSN